MPEEWAKALEPTIALLAGIGMFAGLAIFLLGGRHFRHTRGVNAPLMRAKSLGLPHWGWLLAALLASPLFFTLLFVHDWAGYLLGLVCVAAVVLVTLGKYLFARPARVQAIDSER